MMARFAHAAAGPPASNLPLIPGEWSLAAPACPRSFLQVNDREWLRFVSLSRLDCLNRSLFEQRFTIDQVPEAPVLDNRHERSGSAHD
jgi:hypothetical protein